jgi:hypothetical protein
MVHHCRYTLIVYLNGFEITLAWYGATFFMAHVLVEIKKIELLA